MQIHDGEERQWRQGEHFAIGNVPLFVSIIDSIFSSTKNCTRELSGQTNAPAPSLNDFEFNDDKTIKQNPSPLKFRGWITEESSIRSISSVIQASHEEPIRGRNGSKCYAMRQVTHSGS